MKSERNKASTAQPDTTTARVDRRGVVIGAGAAGAAALAGHALLRGGIEAAPPTGAQAAAAAGKAEGYRLTPHVLRYYETTKA